MGTDTERMRAEIAQTREELGRDVDALNEKVNPARAVERQRARVTTRATDFKDRIMGKASEAKDRASDLAPSLGSGSGSGGGGSMTESVSGSVSGAASSVQGAGSSAKDQVMQRAEGNPLAAGLIAFGVGWLVGSLLPVSEKESRAADSAAAALKEKSQPAVQALKETGQEVADDLKESAQQSAESLKGTAQEATETVRSEAQSSTDNVAGDAKQQAVDVRDTAKQQAGSSSS